MAINQNSLPTIETQALSQGDVAANIGSVAIGSVEEYVSPHGVAVVSAEDVTLGAVRGFEAEQTAGYKPMP